MGIPAINTLSVTPLNAFLAKAAVFNNPWETSGPSTAARSLFSQSTAVEKKAALLQETRHLDYSFPRFLRAALKFLAIS